MEDNSLLVEDENAEGPEPQIDPQAAKQKKKSMFWGFIWEIIQTLALAVILFVLIDTFVARVRVENISMVPTLIPGEFLLVNKFANKVTDLQRGNIIIFHHPADPKKDDYIKRLIGLPGDKVAMRQGKLYVNGVEINEPYIVKPATYEGEWVVPKDEVFVLGDNRDVSNDSHSWSGGPGELASNVMGKAIAIYWPLDKIRILNDTIDVKQ